MPHQLQITLAVDSGPVEVLLDREVKDVRKSQKILEAVTENWAIAAKKKKQVAAWSQVEFIANFDGGAHSEGGSHSSITLRFSVPKDGGVQAVKDGLKKEEKRFK